MFKAHRNFERWYCYCDGRASSTGAARLHQCTDEFRSVRSTYVRVQVLLMRVRARVYNVSAWNGQHAHVKEKRFRFKNDNTRGLLRRLRGLFQRTWSFDIYTALIVASDVFVSIRLSFRVCACARRNTSKQPPERVGFRRESKPPRLLMLVVSNRDKWT
jgi:hypothetical protein